MIFSALFSDCKKINPKIPIIAARTTGAQSPTKKENARIPQITQKIRIHFGNIARSRVINVTHSVILNPLTAIKWVSHELLNCVLSVGSIFSRAQKRIHPRKTASLSGNKVEILPKRPVLKIDIE